ncbi:MAG: DUF4333 domain-containing protein [Nocardioides sp.]
MGGRWQARTALVSVVLATTTLAGCTLGTPKLAKENVEKTVSDKLAEVVGKTPDKVTCPGDLVGKVGTTMRCTLTSDGDVIGLTVKVTKVDGTTVKFDIAVDEQIQGS